MKEHGKLFNTAMVQAFLEGRKNQTRRVADAHNSLVDGNGISKKRWEDINSADSWQANPPVWIYDLQPVGINNKTVPRHG